MLRELERLLPDVQVQLALSVGQIEDPDGFAAAHVDPKLGTYKEPKRRKTLRNTFQSAMIKLGRNAGLHLPDLIIGTGQGALVALAFANPQMLNCAMGTRTCQVEECNHIARGWASTRGVIAIEPRLNVHGVFIQWIREAFPEWNPERQPVASRVAVIVQDEKSAQYRAVLSLSHLTLSPVFAGIEDVPVSRMMDVSKHIVWEHNGVCCSCQEL